MLPRKCPAAKQDQQGLEAGRFVKAMGRELKYAFDLVT